MPQEGQYCNKVFGLASTETVALGSGLAGISLSLFLAAPAISFRSLSYRWIPGS